MSLNYTEVAKAIMALAINAGVKIPDGLIEIWHEAFIQDGYTIEQIKTAASRMIRTKKDFYGRMPTYAELMEAPQNRIADNAEIQATLVISQIGNDYPIFTDPITKHLMSTRWNWNRWPKEVLESELKWFIKEFKEAYLSVSKTERLQLPDKTDAAGVLKMIEIGQKAISKR